MVVPNAVAAAFGLMGTGEELEGGLDPAYRFGETVVKRVTDAVEATYIAEVMASVAVDEAVVTVARPIAASDGTWVVDGWSASAWVPGRPLRRDHPWPAAVAATTALHRGLAAFPRAGVIDGRAHRWAVADRVAWQEQALIADPEVEAIVVPLLDTLDTLEPGTDPSQVVHGDMFSNLLFQADGPPAVIDFSPYWRPAGWALAVYAIDALTWGGADVSLVDLVGRSAAMDRLLRRAAIFRLVALDGYRRETGASIGAELPRYKTMIEMLSRLA